MDLAGLIPSFGNFAFTMVAFVVALSVIVAIHEYGHYIVGRWSGIHAEVFSLGFGPVLWSRHDKHGTKWQIAALPFGGFVKFLGDSSAASGKDGEMISTLSEAELRRTMHGAPLWARTATVLAGPVFNFILAIIVFAGLALSSGVAVYPPVIDTVHPLPSDEYGLKSGDELFAIDGIELPEEEGLSDFIDTLPITPTLDYTVVRDGTKVTVLGPPLSPSRVAHVTPGWAAEAAGLVEGDVILAIGDEEVFEFGQMIPLINGTKGAPTVLKIWREGEIIEITIEAQKRDLPKSDNSFETRYIIGISGSSFYTSAVESPGLADSIVIGGERTWGIITQSISGLYHMVTGAISSCNMSGPIGIAKVSGQMASQGAESFIFFIALLSAAVGLLNLFPIPILDGGHLVFFAYEAVTGKPPSDKALQIMMTTGLVMILSLMVFAVTNDLFCP
ncbi:MAG: RIP metalloprotease RseP [Marinosulfonomonas sp.]|nr:RIP metalloprotease RseP [Marinosulfonomonas sp.]